MVNPLPTVISSITPTPALPRPINLFVFMLVVTDPLVVNGEGETTIGAVAVIDVTVPLPAPPSGVQPEVPVPLVFT
jgi:hypothetical protein